MSVVVVSGALYAGVSVTSDGFKLLQIKSVTLENSKEVWTVAAGQAVLPASVGLLSNREIFCSVLP